jgi:hypothetical protein
VAVALKSSRSRSSSRWCCKSSGPAAPCPNDLCQ